MVLAVAFVAYQVMSTNQNPEAQITEKVKTEIKYIDSRMLVLFNQMNNIQFENYKISINEVTTNSSGEGTEKSSEKSSKSGEGGMGEETSSGSKDSEGSDTSGSESSDSSSGDSGTSNSGTSNSGGGSSSGGDSGGGKNSKSSESGGQSSGGSDSSEGNSSGKDSTTTYNLEPTGVLLEEQEIDWDKIKTEIENMYSSIPTITLDLYQTEVEDQDILNFNTEFDALTKVVEEKNKADTLQQLVKIYESVVKFAEKLNEEQGKVVAKTKLNVYRAYSKLDEQNWEEIAKDTQVAIEDFSKLLTGTQMKDEKQYSINKVYVMLSELQKSIEKQDVQIFLIKYKNTLEELSNI